MMDSIKREDVLNLSEKGSRKQGKWKMGKYDIFTVRCSECFETNGSFTNFCPNCGAEMTNAQNKIR